MATSTRKADYLSRDLQNATPGTTDPVKDYMGRNAATTTTDYTGRNLTVLTWPGAVAMALGEQYWVSGGYLVVTTAGTSAAGAPTIPGTIGGTVASNTVTLTRWR
jgi:hypothetical protein